MDSRPFFAYSHNRWLGTAILVFVVFALAAYAFLTLREARYINTGPTTINVTGEGEVVAVPDVGEFTFAVRAEGESASVAQEQSAAAINDIVSYLREAGVEERDIKNEYYNLNPMYRYEEAPCPLDARYCPPGEQILDGYEVVQGIAVKVRDTNRAGELISGVGERGATNISGLQFTIDDEEVLQAEARASAIADAQEKAHELAEDLDVRIVRIMSYWEEQPYYPMPYGKGGDMMEQAASAAPVIPMGENSVMSRVTITYEVE